MYGHSLTEPGMFFPDAVPSHGDAMGLSYPQQLYKCQLLHHNGIHHKYTQIVHYHFEQSNSYTLDLHLRITDKIERINL